MLQKVPLLLVLIAIVIIAIIGLIGCEEEESPSSLLTAPSPPTNLTAEVIPISQITLVWEDSSDDEDGFEVVESVGNRSNFATVCKTGDNIESITLSNRQPATTYYYRVCSYNANGNSPYSNEATVTIDTLPYAPENLYAQTISLTEIRLTWSDMSENEDSFEVEESVGYNRNFRVICKTSHNTTSLTLTNRQSGTTYNYRIRAYNVAGYSNYSNEATTITFLLTTPENLIAEAVSETEILLTWSDISDNEDGFEVEESVRYNNNFRLVNITGRDTSSFTLTDRQPGITYYYRVRAINADGYSDYSNEASTTTLSLPLSPESLVAEALSETDIHLRWVDMSDNENGFEVEESIGNNRNFLPVDTTGLNVASITLTNRQPGTTYYYRVRAYNSDGNSEYSNEVSSTTYPEMVWSRTYGGGSCDIGFNVQLTQDNGYIIVGYTESFGAGSRDVWLIKTNASGNEQWNRTFGESSNDEGSCVQLTPEGGYIIVGATDSYGAGGSDVWLIKTDASGNEQWNRTFGGNENDYGKCVQPTPDNGYIIVGTTWSSDDDNFDILLIKTDESGQEQWNSTFGGNETDEGNSVQLTLDGGYIIVGNTYSYGVGSCDVWLIKTDDIGNELWNRTFGGIHADQGRSVQLTPDGGYIIVGMVNYFGAGGSDAWLIKTDYSGQVVWDRELGGGEDSKGNCVQLTPDGGYIIVGTTPVRPSYVGHLNILLIKTNFTGQEEWKLKFGEREICEGIGVQVAPDGGYVVLGNKPPYGAGESDIWLIKVGTIPAEQ